MKLNRRNTLMAALVVGATTGLSLPHVYADLVEDKLLNTSIGRTSTADSEPTKITAHETYGKLPLSFEANLGQTDERVNFVSRGSGYALFLTPSEAVISLRKVQSEPSEPKAKPHEIEKATATIVRMLLVGVNPDPMVSGVDELSGRVNYFGSSRTRVGRFRF